MMIEIMDMRREFLDDLTGMFDAYRVFYRKESDPGGARKFLQERFERKDSVIFLAGDTGMGMLCGFVQLYPLYSSTNMGRLWLLNDLYVKPQYRGQGIGRQLIERAKTLARATKAIGLTLETERSNAPANELYPAAGFELDEAHNYYFWSNPSRK